MTKYSGAEWLQKSWDGSVSMKGKKLSPLAAKVADILGQVYKGLYHLNLLDHQLWFEPHGVYFYLSSKSELATYDFSELTSLVLLCHEQAVRLSISTGEVVWQMGENHEHDFEDFEFHSFRDGDQEDTPDRCWTKPCLVLGFHQRSHFASEMSRKHPTVAQAVEAAKALNEAIK